jgi:hypothetical protein
MPFNYGLASGYFGIKGFDAPKPTYGGQPAAPTPDFGGKGNDASSFLKALYEARPNFVAQQGELLSKLGPSLRQSVFTASPELAQASNYLQKTFEDPYGGSLSTYQDAIRGAQAARGFGGGGTGVTGEEGRYLTNFAERRRQELLPQLSQFGSGLLNIAGLGGPPDITLAGLGSLALGSRQLSEQVKAGQSQSLFASSIFGGLTGNNNTSYLPGEDFYSRQTRLSQQPGASFNYGGAAPTTGGYNGTGLSLSQAVAAGMISEADYNRLIQQQAPQQGPGQPAPYFDPNTRYLTGGQAYAPPPGTAF